MLYDTMRVEERLILKELRDLGANVALINIDNVSLSLNDGGDFGIVLVRPMSHSKAGLVLVS